MIENGGVKLDGRALRSDEEIEILRPILLQVGKRKFKRIVPAASGSQSAS